jgi:DNA-binding HxlR family transcriptional regulator
LAKDRLSQFDVGKACPVEATLTVIGGKWKCVILWHLAQDGTSRFTELKRRLQSITQRMLTNQLRELEADGLIDRKVYAQVPPKVEYSLSERGQTLWPVLDALQRWGADHADFFRTRRAAADA